MRPLLYPISNFIRLPSAARRPASASAAEARPQICWQRWSRSAKRRCGRRQAGACRSELWEVSHGSSEPARRDAHHASGAQDAAPIPTPIVANTMRRQGCVKLVRYSQDQSVGISRGRTEFCSIKVNFVLTPPRNGTERRLCSSASRALARARKICWLIVCGQRHERARPADARASRSIHSGPREMASRR